MRRWHSVLLMAWAFPAVQALGQVSFQQVALTGEPVPGANDQAVFDTLGFPSLNNSGQVAFSAVVQTGAGAAVTIDNDELIVSTEPGNPEGLGIVAREGDQAPGFSDGKRFVFYSFGSPFEDIPISLNDSGDVAFLGAVESDDIGLPSREIAIFGPSDGAGSDLGPVVREGEPAPDVSDGAEFSFFSDPVLNNRGDVLFESFLRTGTGPVVTRLNERAIFLAKSGPQTSLELIGREDLPAPGLADGAEYSEFDSLSLNNNGDVAFEAELRTGTGADVTTLNRDAIFGPTSGTGSALGLVARSGSMAPGVPGNVDFSSLFGAPILNNSGDVSFAAQLRATNAEAIFGPTSGANSALGLIAREGEIAPGAADSATFDRFTSHPSLNDAGDIAFEAFLDPNSGTDNRDAVFGPILGSGSALSMIIRQGDPVPNIDGDFEFDFSRAPVLNDLGNMAILAGIRPAGSVSNDANPDGLFVYVDGELTLVVREGDEFEVASSGGGGGVPKMAINGEVETRTVSAIFFDSLNNGGIGFNNANVLAFGLRFTDGSEGIFTARVGVIPEPGSLFLAAIALLLGSRRDWFGRKFVVVG